MLYYDFPFPFLLIKLMYMFLFNEKVLPISLINTLPLHLVSPTIATQTKGS